MKNKKGFTLIEMLGIMIVLTAIMLLVIPIVDKSLQKRKDNLYETQIENLSLALKNWGAENMFNLPNEEGGSITVTLGQLKQAGFIDEDVSNPVTGKCFPNDMLLTITKKGNNYKYEVIEDSGSASCDNEVNLNAPIIGLKGRTVVYVEINTPYVEPGLIVTKANGAVIPQDQVVKTISGPKDFVDTSVLGTYQISYTITDAGATSSIVRTVIVRDTIAPVITLEKITTITTLGTSFDILDGVSASDNSGIQPTLSTKGTVNTNVSGTYEIVYTATDSSGNKTKEKRKIIVNDTTPPEIAVTIVGNPFNAEGWANSNVVVNVKAYDASGGVEKVVTCIGKNGKCTPTTTIRQSNTDITVKENGDSIYVCAYAEDTSKMRSETVCTNSFKMDLIPPTCTTAAPIGTEGNNGWFKSGISVTGTCTDTNGSGCVAPTVTSEYGSNTSAAGTTLSPGVVTDVAGNSTQCPKSVNFKIDMNPPTCATTVNRTLNAKGWYQTKTITATGTCTDEGESGCVGNTTIDGAEGRYTIQPGDVSDNAGNTASCPSMYVQVDGTIPEFGGTSTYKPSDSNNGKDVAHKHKIYDNVSKYSEMRWEYYWCYGNSSTCSSYSKGYHYIKGESNFGTAEYLDAQHVLNRSNGKSGTIWFKWIVTDAAGNKRETCWYSNSWSNYTSNGYTGC